MLRVYSCLTVDHDWRLVALAVIMCFLASAVAISLFHRAQATIERTRIAWLGLDAVVAGGGIWATHFIAMLAYDPGIGAGYNLVVTILSLLIAMLVTGVGLGIALLFFGRWTAVLGGAVVGGGIAAMHYTGMMALEVPGRITWLPNLVVVSVVLGVAFGALSVYFAARRDDWLNTLIAIFLLTFAIVGTHFTGMGAVVIMPDPTRVNGATFVSPASLSLVIAGVAAIILGICLAVALSDRQSKEKLRQQKLLLDTALENMSQGLCMFDADGNIALFNERYAKLMGLPAEWLKGRSLLELLERRKASGEFADDPVLFFGTGARGDAPRQIQHQDHAVGGRACPSRRRTADAGRRLGRNFGGHHRMAESSGANLLLGTSRCAYRLGKSQPTGQKIGKGACCPSVEGWQLGRAFYRSRPLQEGQ
jgi:NO-binding membrane sensor protein with MHYT domain